MEMSLCQNLYTRLHVIAATLLLLAVACSRVPSDKDLVRTDRLCSEALLRGDYALLDSLAPALAEGDEAMRAKGHYYLGSFRPEETPEESRLRSALLDQAQAEAESAGNDTLLCRVHNARGCRFLASEGDYAGAITEFRASMDLAQTLGDRRLEAVAEVNLSELLRDTGDTLGHYYDRKLFEYAQTEAQMPSVLMSSAFHCARYCLRGLEPEENFEKYLSAIPAQGQGAEIRAVLRAEQSLLQGRPEETLSWLDTITPSVNSLSLQIRALEALGKWRKVLETSARFDALKNVEREHEWLVAQPSVARAQIETGDSRGSFDRLQRYIAANDTFKARLQDVVTGRYRVEYQVAKKDAEIAERKADVRVLTVTLAVGGAVVLLGALLTVWYLRKRRNLYREIVRQNRSLEQRIAAAAATQPKTHEISTEVTDDVWNKICQEMDNGIWADPGMSREAFAERVGSNRTYFSKIIKDKTGMTYTQYINSERIRHAMATLSDPSVDVQMKELAASLGFVSLSTFYNIFRQTVGISPAAYRKTALGMTD